jgi:DNA gyrase subunit A
MPKKIGENDALNFDDNAMARDEFDALIQKDEGEMVKNDDSEMLAEPVPLLDDTDIIFTGGVSTVEDQVQPRHIEVTMRTNFLNYAMSVIASRALPDVRDGLKPVHRRILYAMQKMGNTPGARYMKSAGTVGEVIKNYHPHGDQSIYSAMVRLAQDFSLRYPLVDGQGNWGSIDGDGAAAYRYTEARMSVVASYMLRDIEKDTVDMRDNFDGSTKEPSVLPTVIPNLLINGQTGIAVGMATEIPPHNLGEVIAATVALLKNPELTIEELVHGYIQGPDLPTGATIFGKEDLLNAYKTGRGRATVRAQATVEEEQIVITEIPYMVNKADMLAKIAQMVRDKKIEGIREIRDESNKDGLRVVIETKRDASPEIVLNLLYKHSELESAVHFNMVGLINRGREPKLLNLKELLSEFIKHRVEVVMRRCQFELKKAQDELHILDGLKIALDHIDEVIAIIRGSYDKDEAISKLQARFDFSDRQAEAILQMRLQALTNLDKSKIEKDRDEKIATIARLTEILENELVRNAIIEEEMTDAAERLKSKRRTIIMDHRVGEFNKEQFVVDESVLLQLTSAQYIKYIPLTDFSQQGRGGRGKMSFNPKDEDFVKQSVVCSSHDIVYAFTSKGRVFKTRVFDLPSGSRQGRGQNLVNYLQLQTNETIARILTISKEQEESQQGTLVFATKKGKVKRTLLELFKNTRQTGIIAIGLKPGDSLIDVLLSSDQADKVVLSANNGKTVIFDIGQIGEMGRGASGVKGIRLKEGEEVISLEISSFDFAEGGEADEPGDGALIAGEKEKKYPTLLVVTELGYSKQTHLSGYRKTNRAASGVKTMHVTKKTGRPVIVHICTGDEEDLVVTTKKGVTIRLDPQVINHLGRSTQGIRAIKLDDKDVVVSGSIL